MAAPASTEEFLDLVRKSGVTDERKFTDYVTRGRAANSLAPDASRMAGLLVRDGILTQFQAEQILQGKWRRFTIGKYKVLERIGAGGMGSVYLCEHKLMRRRVAVKVLPTAKASDPSSLERFYREARAVAALDHPNIVHAYDIDQDEQLHFLVMEYVDGASFQEMVKRVGPIDILRACHYMRQAAVGLEHAAAAGLVHRDIKPGNILVDRTGLVKILDMGLARFFNDEDDVLTKKFDENVLGTADYLAPEQAIDSHGVDIRADIYSLGATFYFLLTGRTPFGEGTVAQKLLWHQTRQPKPVSEYRKDCPPELVAIISKMMDKDANNRFQTPAELADALIPFTQEPIGPPPEAEMPTLSAAAQGISVPSGEAPDTAVTQLENVSKSPKALQTMSGTSARPSGTGSKPNHSVDTSTVGATTPLSPTPKSRPPAKPEPTPAPKPSSPAASKPKTPAPKPNLPTPKSKPAPPPEPEPSFSPVDDEESPAAEDNGDWGAFTADAPTPKAAAASLPEPKTGPKSSKSSKKSMKTAASPPVGKKNKLLLPAIVGGVLLLLVIFGVAASFMTGSPKAIEAPATRILEVSSDLPGAYKSIGQAIVKAKKGDVIQLHDPLHLEYITLDFDRLKIPQDLTLQVAPGKQVVWQSNSRQNQDRQILDLRKAQNFKIEGTGLTLDGTLDDGKLVNFPLEIYSKSPGLTIQNLTIKNFGQTGIRFMNAAGEANRPIRIIDCEVIGDNNRPAAVYLDANKDIMPDKIAHVEFEKLRINGPKIALLPSRPNVVDAATVKGAELAEPLRK